MEATRASAALILATLGLLVLIACGPNVYEGRDGVPLNGLQISESQHGETWPLNVSGGSLDAWTLKPLFSITIGRPTR